MQEHPHAPRFARLLVAVCLRTDVREVIEGDLNQEFSDALATGVRPGRARRRYWRQALASIAAVGRHNREHRHMNRQSFQFFRGLSLDARAVTRTLRRSPGYAAVAILSLAVGIGANTAIVSVVRQLVLAPLPVDRPDELRLAYWDPGTTESVGMNTINQATYDAEGGRRLRSNYSYLQYTAMRDAIGDLGGLSGYNSIGGVTASVDGRPPVNASGLMVDGRFFDVLRPPLALGRGIVEADDQAGAPLVGVISYRLWSRLFGTAPDVLSRTLRVNDTPMQIVGVTAERYRGLSPGGFSAEPDITIAIAQQPVVSPQWSYWGGSLFTSPNIAWVRVMARVPDDAEPAAAAALTTAFRAGSAGADLTEAQFDQAAPVLLSAARGLDTLRTSTTQPLSILSAVVGVVLLIACINVAGLMLARGVARQRELTVRRALGASRARIVRELLVESVALSMLGGAAGLLLALMAAPVLQSLLSAGLGTREIGLSVDWSLFVSTAVIACGAGILAGLIPAIRFSRNPTTALRDRTTAGAPKLLAGRAILAIQIAVTIPLVVGAGLFLRTLHNLTTLDVGFNPAGIALFELDPTLNGKVPERAATVFPRVLEQLEAVPGVTSATLLENALISRSESDTTIKVGDIEDQMYINNVGPHYFETMGIRLLAGRAIESGDVAGRPDVVVINQSAADRFFPGQPAVGQRFKNGSRELEVVGVMADSKYDHLRNPVPPTMLQPYLQRRVSRMTVAVRTEGDPAAYREVFERAVTEVDPTIPLTNYQTQVDQINETIGKERVFVRLLTAFGAFALLLACVGLHGVTSYSVARRTSEIGVRLALGAQPGQVQWMILRQVLVLCGVGLLMGLPIAYLLGPAVGSLLFGLAATDAATMIGAAIVMVVVALGAGYWPARRAARLEALHALRAE